MKTIQDVKEFFFADLKLPDHKKLNKVRIVKKLAKEMLLNNEIIILDGKVKWFKIRELGLGVCEVELNDAKNTCFER